jgi:hypothetical protein
MIFANETATQIFWGSSTTPGAAIGVSGGSSAPNLNLSQGGHYNGTNWVADSTSAQDIDVASAFGIGFFSSPSLTVGNTFTPTQIAALNGSGFNLKSGSYQVNGTQIVTSNLADVSSAPTAFTPTLSFSTTTAGIVYTFPSGFWFRQGKFIWVQMTMGVSSLGTSSGNASLCGLPYASYSGTNQGPYYVANFSGVPSPAAPIYGFLAGNSTCMALQTQPTNGGAATAMNAGSVGGFGNLQVSFVYMAN